MHPFDPHAVLRLEPLNTHGTEITPGSDVVGEDFDCERFVHKWADTQPGGDAIHDALFRAYFVDGVNIGDVDSLVAIAKSIGLSPEAAREVLDKRTHKEAVDADWEKSHAYGVTGVPTFVAGRHGVVGAQPYEALVQLVSAAKA